MALIIGVVIVLLILFGFLCYKKAPPTEAIVVTGFGLARPKVVCGKGTFVLPVLQRADRLNMRLLKIDVKTPETGVKTQNGVSLWIDSVVTIQVYSENSTVLDEEVKASGLKDAKAYIMSRQQAAISNFLGMNEQGINDKVNDVLQGNLREIVSDMTVDQILTNRKQMALSVIENARPDLAKMGLEVVTFNVQDIRDAIPTARQTPQFLRRLLPRRRHRKVMRLPYHLTTRRRTTESRELLPQRQRPYLLPHRSPTSSVSFVKSTTSILKKARRPPI